MNGNKVMIQTELVNILLNACSQPFEISTCDGRIMLVNQAFCELLGYEKAELVKLNHIKDLTPAEWHSQERVLLEELKRSKHPTRYEKEFIHKQGYRIAIEAFSHIMATADGSLYNYAFITDISEREKSETVKFGNLVEDIAEGIYTLDRDWRLTYINKTARLLLGKLEGDLFGKDFRKELPISPCFYEAFRKSLDSGQSCHFIGYSSCGKRWLDTHIFPLKNGLSILFKDIEVKQQAKERFEIIFQFHPNPMLISTLAEGRHFDVNRAFLQLTGYKREELIGRLFKESNMWMLTKEREDILSELKERSQIDNYETSIRAKSGEIRLVLCNINTIKMEGIEYILTSIIDITERKNAQERFDKAFHDNTSLMAIIKLADYRYVDVNQSWVNVTGYRRDEFIGRTSLELNIWENYDQVMKCFQQVEHGEKPSNIEMIIIHKSGEMKTLLVCLDIIKLHGEDHILSVGLDISERKKYEQVRARSDRLELIGQMATGISHELRNPMTTVRGYLQFFSRKKQFKNFFSSIEIMIAELDRANAIISEFLFLARNRAVERKAIYLPGIIKELMPIIEADGKFHNKRVIAELSPVPLTLIDSKEIERLLLNLVRNGYESMSAGGTLSISTYFEKDQVILAVRDQGCGISQEFISQIGRPFFSTKANGTGLGLAICYSIAQRQHAIIDFQTSSEGTVFYVRFTELVSLNSVDIETSP